MKKYLEYYKQIKSIPTVDLKDLNTQDLIRQRFNFYFKLGVTDKDLESKSVLELCPGTGYNSYYLLKYCNIKKIKLVEKNPYSLQKLRKNLRYFKNKKIVNSNIFKFNTKEKFDYVILENTIGGFSMKESISTFKKLQKFTSSKGVIILTFPNLYGLLSSKLRFLYSVLLIKREKILNFNNRLNFLKKIFDSHFRYLSKNPRKTENWILDMIFFENYIRKIKYFDVHQMKKFLGNNFLIKSFMPQSFSNYIWYKNTTRKSHNFTILNQIKDNQINFLDYETKFSQPSKIEKNIKNINFLVSKISFEKKIDKKIIKKINFEIKKLSKCLNDMKKNNKVSLALNELNLVIEDFIANKKLNKKMFYFKKFWGIGSNVVCLYKI